MSNKEKILLWEEQNTIRSYEADPEGYATIALLCRLIQESASNHAEHLGFGLTWLHENNYAWFLTRILFVMESYPKLGDSVKVTTWTNGRDSLLWYRDFHILNNNNEVIGKISSAWLVIDLMTRRPKRADDLPLLHPQNEIEPALERVPGKITKLIKPESGFSTCVGYRNLDVNEHVNSALYIDWILESFDPEFHKNNWLIELEVNYLNEARFNDKITANLEKSNQNTYLHNLIRESDQSELFRAKSIWERKK